MLKQALLMAAATLALAPRANAAALKIGAAPPPLQVSKFVKGVPVTEFEQGHTYVVEFWATWCGPCRMSIPHLTEMQKKYKDVRFVGVSVWENDQSAVEPFVKQMGDKMDYTVAMDDVPAGKSGNDGFMAKNWMTAAGQNGIPTAFVINKDSKIAWIGHPMQIDEPLGKIVDGTWDINAAAERFDKEQAAQQKMMELQQSLGKAMQAKDYNGALTIVNSAFADQKDLETMLAPLKVQLLHQLGRDGDARAYETHLVDDVFKDSAPGLNSVAWPLVDPDSKHKPDPAEAKLALRAALHADELSKHKDAAILDTLAAAYYANGNVAKAVATQQRALEAAKGTAEAKDPSLQQHLELYQKAAH